MATKKGTENDNTETRITLIGQYAVMQHDATTLSNVIRQNLGGGRIQQSALDRIKVPTGGGTTWTIPGVQGEIESKHLDGVIVAWKEPRAYWKDRYTGGKVPPDCKSDDSVIGVGKPGGECSLCRYAKFGSAVNEKGQPTDGQACKQVRLMAILQRDDLVPVLLAAPPSSLAELGKYFMRLSRSATPYYGVVTRFTLRKDRNKAGTEYSAIEATALEKLGTEELDRIQAYVATFGRSLERETAHADDIAE